MEDFVNHCPICDEDLEVYDDESEADRKPYIFSCKRHGMCAGCLQGYLNLFDNPNQCPQCKKRFTADPMLFSEFKKRLKFDVYL